jgi:hypothetical protein
MRSALPKLFLIPCLLLALLSCDQDINSAKDQPLVDYVVIVTDSAANTPLDSVRIDVTTITGDTASYTTTPEEGRAQLATVASSRTLLQFTRRGYNSRDSIDTVNAPVDTVFHRPIVRLLRVRMSRIGQTVSSRAQINLLPRNANLEKLKQTTVLFEDSTGDLRSISDTGGTGIVGLVGLKVGKTSVLVKNPGYLGHWFEVSIERSSDTARVPSQVVSLVALGGNRITGQVYSTTSSLPKPLLGAKVEFRLKDTLADPKVFTTFTLPKEEDFGRFILDSVPALDGQVLYYKDRTSLEAIKTVPILREEVLRDGPLPLVILTIGSDSSFPYLLQHPKDSVNARDSLLFRFSQKVVALDGFSVRLINQSELLLDSVWNTDKTQLKIWQKDGQWIRGKKYEYQLTARNAAGQYFTAQGDTLKVLRGIFSIPDTTAGADSTLLLPKNISFAFFNSGAYHLFSESDTNSSPKPDSSSQFARLKWGWSAGRGHKVDSLVLFYKDDAGGPVNWTLWGAVPASLDSATVNFSDHYATSREAKHPETLPFKTPGAKLYFRIFPKQAGTTLPDTILDALEQGMGPTVYSFIKARNTPFKTGNGATDSLQVFFLKDKKDPSSGYDWGNAGVRPTPVIYFNNVKVDTTLASWNWVDGEEGNLVYKLPGVVGSATRIVVDLNGVQYLGKPIWQRNRLNEFVLP